MMFRPPARSTAINRKALRQTLANIRTTREVLSLRWRRSAAALYAAVWVYSLLLGVAMIAMPWRIMSLGGKEAAVGLVGAIQMGVYAVACVPLARVAERLGAKGMAMTASGCAALCIVCMVMAPSVTALLTLVGIQAVAMSMFWPPVMGWISAGHEEAGLNRRLGIFNCCWSSGVILGTFLGGVLFRLGPRVPFVVAASLSLVMLVLIASARRQRGGPVLRGASVGPAQDLRLPLMRAMARIAVVGAWLAVGVVWYPFAIFLKQCLAAGPQAHGTIGSAMNVAMMCGFLVMGRMHRWHYNRAFFWGSQAVTAGMLLLLALSRTAWQAGAVVAMMSLAIAVIYVSNLYYGVSGGKRRAASMALHETLLSVGFFIGSLGGGLIAQWYSPRAIFPIAAGAIAAGVVVQAFVFFYCRAKRGRGTLSAP